MSFDIFRSKKGFEKLGHDGYLYNMDKRNANYTLWRCELSKKPGHRCTGRAKLTEFTLEVYRPHSHPPNPAKVEADILKSKIYEAAEDPTSDSKFLLQEAAQLASCSSGSAAPKLCSMQRVISRKRRSCQIAAGIVVPPQKRSIPPSMVSSGVVSLHSLFGCTEQLRLLFTPSGGMEEIKPMLRDTKPVSSCQGKLLPWQKNSPEQEVKSDIENLKKESPKSVPSWSSEPASGVDVKCYLKMIAEVAAIEDLTSYELALLLDEKDPLKHLRTEFHYPKMKTLPNVDHSLIKPDDDCIYMCGNSLGLMPKATKAYMDEQFEKWANMGIFGRLEKSLPETYADEIVAEGIANLVGAEPSEVALMSDLTVNLQILLMALYKPTESRYKILLESKAFLSDRCAIESQIRLHGFSVEECIVCLQPKEEEDCLRMDDILAFIEREGHSTAVILFSGIQYYTGQLFDIRTITDAAHAQGCLVGWDLTHAFANVPLSLHDWDVDFACWYTYKYGCSGVGSLGGFFVHKKYETDQRERMLEWWSHRIRFDIHSEPGLDDGAAGYRISNPPMMFFVPLLGILDVFKKTTLQDLRVKSILLTGYLEFLINYHIFSKSLSTRKVSCKIITPSDPAQRGCQLSLKFNVDIANVYKELTKRGVVVNKRYRDVIEVTPVHLYNSFSDVHRFVSALLQSLKVLEETS